MKESPVKGPAKSALGVQGCPGDKDDVEKKRDDAYFQIEFPLVVVDGNDDERDDQQ